MSSATHFSMIVCSRDPGRDAVSLAVLTPRTWVSNDKISHEDGSLSITFGWEVIASDVDSVAILEGISVKPRVNGCL